MPVPRMTTPLLVSEFIGAQQQTPSMTHEFQAFYNSPAVERSAFPYFLNFRVYKGFWDRILCFTDNGYLDDSPSKQYYGCGYFIWKDDLDLQLRESSSHGPSTPQGSSPRPSTNPSSYHELSTHPNSSLGFGPTECSNCNAS
ncbi:hypothetical protein Tco_0569076 [Tanacetum coccineum]